ncbi:NAD-dependent malic enzyme [Pseudonocardia acidicola]|uniref:NAD-dependent malic enzyme n=1 Tax=Pseudonocardia acidicola TaxID=2724939 RepID=A0ABX1SGR7_9PSEU|nr:NAD-dependent malic enzyme [Pseudonocardia acidicola]NMH99586.1 NAD-dependent malic enzyme [Pseudonocardia acidicola]
MNVEPYELVSTPDGITARIRARGRAVLATPMINRGTAFTTEERDALGLAGLLPDGVSTPEGQLRRVYAQYQRVPDDLARNVFLANLRDRNEVLFYALLAAHLPEMLPIVYTPTIGQAIERYSHEYHRPRGVYLSIDRPQDVEQSFRNFGLGPDDVDLIVATDAEGILGIGDQGVGGIEIAIGKLSVYTAAAGIHPNRVIPVVLDVGTDNRALLDDDLYLGHRGPRVRDQRYDDLIETYVTTASRLFPHAMLHWEDFGAGNARRILQLYAGRYCTFNDDMQGTAAVVLAAAFSAVRTAGTRMRDQHVVVHGAGTAGLGIADMMREVMIGEGLSEQEATSRFWALGSRGLLVDDSSRLRDFQLPYARPAAQVAGWPGAGAGGGGVDLATVVEHVRPTMLIGTSAQAGAFSEPVVKQMAAHTERPIIMPLSNPTPRAEALPADLLAWTDGRALIATGSPFAPVPHGTRTHRIAQANNALVFPGIGLGVTVARARRVSDGMIAAAAGAVARLAATGSGDRDGDDAAAPGPGAALLPPIEDLWSVSAAVAAAVVRAAVDEGLAQVPVTDPDKQVEQAMWRPRYPRIEVC